MRTLPVRKTEVAEFAGRVAVFAAKTGRCFAISIEYRPLLETPYVVTVGLKDTPFRSRDLARRLFTALCKDALRKAKVVKVVDKVTGSDYIPIARKFDDPNFIGYRTEETVYKKRAGAFVEADRELLLQQVARNDRDLLYDVWISPDCQSAHLVVARDLSVK